MSDLAVPGIGRVGDNEKAICLYFNRKLTDDEVRKLHKIVRAFCLRLSFEAEQKT
jgi:hypothetical protein